MTTKLLSESTAVATKAGNGRWKSVLITPGQGSSGYYSESVLREYGPLALRKGAKSFVTHNRAENGEPDPFAMWGFLAEDSYYEEGVGLVGVIEVLPSWRDKVDEVAPHVALSVYVSGEADSDGNVTKFVEDVQNGVDMVVYPGRPGSSLVEQMVESAAKMARESDEPTVTSAVEKEKEIKMEDLEKVVAAVEALTAQVSALVAKENAAQAEAIQAEVDQEAVEARVSAYDAAVDAIEAAELPADAAKSLRAEARKGVDIAPLIEFAKTVKSAAITESATGREFGGEKTSRFGAWS